MDEISIIIPAKNEGEGIERIINSAIPFSDDILVVDANSKDGTEEICKSYGIKYVMDDGRGKGSAMAIGVKSCKYNDLSLIHISEPTRQAESRMPSSA